MYAMAVGTRKGSSSSLALGRVLFLSHRYNSLLYKVSLTLLRSGFVITCYFKLIVSL